MANQYYLTEALEELGEVLYKELMKTVPVHTGELRDSVSYSIKDNVLIFSYNEYGQFLNDGTMPHNVPVDSIRTWALSKGLNPWAVAKNISKFGTEPNNWLRPVEDFESEYFNLLEDATFEALEGYVWEKISKYKK